MGPAAGYRGADFGEKLIDLERFEQSTAASPLALARMTQWLGSYPKPVMKITGQRLPPSLTAW